MKHVKGYRSEFWYETTSNFLWDGFSWVTSQSSQGGVGAGAQGHYAPAIAGGVQPRPMGMAPQPLPTGSGADMQPYDFDDEEMTKLKAEKGGRAGGWSVELSRKRALEEAFSSIWL